MMCLAIPGKIVKINGDEAVIDYDSEKRAVKIIDPVYKVGDYVFVQAGIVIQKIPKNEALQAINAWKKALKNEN
jgi:hydrogenase expression/formation protein HypC